MMNRANKILKLIITCAVLMIPFTGFAQKMDKTQVDPFINVTTYSTTMGLLASNAGTYLHVYLSKADGVYYINLWVELSTSSYQAFSINQGNALLFKLESGDVLTLSNTKAADSQRYIFVEDYRHQEFWATQASAVLTDAALNEMALSKTMVIRITANDRNIDFTINQKDAIQIFKMLSLITKAS